MPRTTTPPLTLLLLAALATACDATADGARAYGGGRFAEAHAAFARAADAAGDSASAELLYDRALAALRNGDLADAETSAKRAAERGGAGFAALRDFLLGNVAWARCDVAAAQAEGPEAEPFAYDVAIAHASAAREAWQRAAVSRADWPEARRNVERALLREDDLRRRKADATRARKTAKGGPRIRLRPVPTTGPKGPETKEEAPPAPTPGAEATEDPRARVVEGDLPRDAVLGLLETLAQKEREKLAQRRAGRAERSAEVERDW